MTSHYLTVPNESRGRQAFGEGISYHFVRAQKHEFEKAIQCEFPHIVLTTVNINKIDPKQIPRIQSKLNAIMRPIAQQIITDVNEGKCIKEVGLWGVVETAGMLMHKNPLGRDNRAREHGPHKARSR